jgi:uncharacterized membrane protein YeaQ/YmgE (transglycosylase-associated protein family)
VGLPIWIAFGLVVGIVARWVVPGEGPAGVGGDIVVGILGSLAGVWIYHRFEHADVSGFTIPTMVCALIGAVLLLSLLRAVSGRSTA